MKLFAFRTLLISAAFLLPAIYTSAQTKIEPSDKIVVSGEIKTEVTITLDEIMAMAAVEIGDMVITNHNGETKKTLTKMKGVSFKAILEKIEINTENARELSRYYFSFVATDGYTVVYSWNEIFNSETGNHIFIVTEKDGKSIKDSDDRILVVTTTDFRTGRRHVKSLAKIIVGKV